LGLSQVAFADCIGVAPNTVARWERGELGMRESTKRLLTLLIQQTDLTTPVLDAPTTAATQRGKK
jgi:DNA-binding transcriptional regulator YiaG